MPLYDTILDKLQKASVKIVSSENYTILDDDHYIDVLVTAGASNRTINLPTLAANLYRRLKIKKMDTGAGKVIVTPEGAELINNYNSTFEITEQGGELDIVGLSTHWEATPNENCCIYRTTSTSNITLTNTSGVWEDALTLAVPAGIYNLETEGVHYFRNTSFSQYVILYFGLGLTTGNVAPEIKYNYNYLYEADDYIERYIVFQKVEKKNYTIASPATLRLKTCFISDESATTHILECEATSPAILEARRIR